MRLSGWAPWCVPGPMVPLLLLVLLCGGCQIQSAPQCFRSSSSENVYLCEWNSSAQNHVIHFGKEKQFPVVGENCIMVREEKVFTSSEGEVWVEPEGRPSCASPKINITLAHTIRFDRPQRLSVRWSQDNLTLSWSAPEKTRAAVEIRHQEPSYQWRTMNLTTDSPTGQKLEIRHQEPSYQCRTMNLAKDSKTGLKYSLMVPLQQSSVQQLQIRHRSTTAKNPLWSHWSQVLTAPPAFSRIRKKRVNETTAEGKVRLQRRLRINWKSVPNALKYHVEVASPGGKDCSCSTVLPWTNSSLYYESFGSFAAANVTIRAANAEGESPPAMYHVAPEIPPDLTLCNKTALKKRVCRQWYELWDGRAKEQTLISLLPEKNNIEPELKDFVPYIYYEHKKCVTRRVCLFYQQQGKPVSPPQNLVESLDYKTVSWNPIPSQDQHGLIIYYSLCVQSGQTGPDCKNISSSKRSFDLNDLSPGAMYNVTLSGATAEGEGPRASVTIDTTPGRPYNMVLSLGLLICFFLLSTGFTFIFTRIQNKLLPPLPSPLIPDFAACKADVQEVMEEEVLTVTLLQLQPECCPLQDTEEHCSLSHLHQEDQDHPSQQEDRDKPSNQEPSDVQPLQRDICLLIYKNGLVFDSNSDST